MKAAFHRVGWIARVTFLEAIRQRFFAFLFVLGAALVLASEAVRVLRPGGRLLLLDLRSHDQAWVRTRFGDRHLGFSPQQLSDLMTGAGLTQMRVQVGSSKAGDPFAVLVASGVKPAVTHSRSHR